MTILTRDEIIVCLQKLNVIGITVYQQEGIRQACEMIMRTPEWVSVKDRLPDLDVRVLVARKGNTKSSKNHVGEDYRGKRFGGKWGKTSGYYQVAHWADMPKAPT